MLNNQAYIIESESNVIKLSDEARLGGNDMLLHGTNDIANGHYYVFTGINPGWSTNVIAVHGMGMRFTSGFDNNPYVEEIRIVCFSDNVTFDPDAFSRFNHMKKITIFTNGGKVTFGEGSFQNSSKYVKVNIFAKDTVVTNNSNIPDENITVSAYDESEQIDKKAFVSFDKYLTVTEKINNLLVDNDNGARYAYDKNSNPPKIYFTCDSIVNNFTMKVTLQDLKFGTVGGNLTFEAANPDYTGTAYDALSKCTKCAVYDGRIFLTGNQNLPNTVFYSQRNLTGENDPTYWGVYNYFNDGVGNTPNVDILSTPTMLMVIKGDTVQDGSVFYHVGTYNTDEESKNLLPRIYPSTQGAAGLGSAGDTVPSRLSCNFFDDPVFLSRGLEGVSKEAVNLERTVQHRSSNVDRLLIREDLARATMAEWKNYLVICCNGHMYLADSRYMIQHTDGSYQYEWYYLEGLGTYESYDSRWEYLEGRYPYVDDTYTLADYIVSGERISDVYTIRADGAELSEDAEIMHVLASSPDGSNDVDIHFVIKDGKKYIVVPMGEEKRGVGKFFGATKIVAVNDRLIFGTDNGDICIINTDMRGVSVDGRAIEPDRIDRSFYSFNGVPYLSGCAIRLDDCEQKLFTKNTVCGTTTARFKMMPGSHCYAMVSTNGRDWEKLGEAGSSRFDFADLDFTNMSFAENENNVVVFPEISRGWMNKQYYFYSDSFEAPFGLYELGYAYYVAGRIRY